VDDRRAACRFDDRRTVERGAQLEEFAREHVGEADAARDEVDLAPPFARLVHRPAGARQLRGRELPDLGDRDEMDAD